MGLAMKTVLIIVLKWLASLVNVGGVVAIIVVQMGNLSPVENIGAISMIITVVAIWSERTKRKARWTATIFNTLWLLSGIYFAFAQEYEAFIIVFTVLFALLSLIAAWANVFEHMGNETTVEKP